MKTETTERPSTKSQRSYIYKLCSYDERTKEEMVQWATGDIEKISTHDLNYEQADAIIKQMLGKKSKVYVHPYGAFDFNNPRHRKVLSLCIEYGWKLQKNGRDIADITHLGIWLESHPKAPVHKPLKKMDDDELSKTVYAMQQMVKWKYK